MHLDSQWSVNFSTFFILLAVIALFAWGFYALYKRKGSAKQMVLSNGGLLLAGLGVWF